VVFYTESKARKNNSKWIFSHVSIKVRAEGELNRAVETRRGKTRGAMTVLWHMGKQFQDNRKVNLKCLAVQVIDRQFLSIRERKEKRTQRQSKKV